MALRAPPLPLFRSLLWELYEACGRPERWPEEVARAEWRKRYPNWRWRAMERRTWRDRLFELRHKPRPPETDPKRLERELGEDRLALEGMRRSRFLWGDRMIHEQEQAIVRKEIELALRHELGPPKRKRPGRRKKVDEP
jgi:hypothetical protein